MNETKATLIKLKVDPIGTDIRRHLIYKYNAGLDYKLLQNWELGSRVWADSVLPHCHSEQAAQEALKPLS